MSKVIKDRGFTEAFTEVFKDRILPDEETKRRKRNSFLARKHITGTTDKPWITNVDSEENGMIQTTANYCQMVQERKMFYVCVCERVKRERIT